MDPLPVGRGRPEPGTPLYVHLPFCAAKCPYCDFFSVPAEGHDLEGMVEALLVEAAWRAPESPRTVFLGGGTPSLLEPRLLRRLLDGLDACTGFRASAVEVTAECNPESLDLERAQTLLEGGVERLSIGFQSLRPDVLTSFGRVHGVEESFAAYAAAREARVPWVSIDLIFAAPDTTPAEWREDLARVLALGPDHLSAYALIFEPGTRFEALRRQGALQPVPEDDELEMFLATRELAAAAGLEAYEISNFSREHRQCLHNINYWLNGPYSGIGPSAASHVAGVRSVNVRSIEGYRARIAAERDALASSEQLAPRARLGETWWLGLRMTAGVEPRRALAVAGLEGEDPAAPLVERLVAQELLETRGGHVRLTARGLVLADAVGSEFLALAEDEDDAAVAPKPAAKAGDG